MQGKEEKSVTAMLKSKLDKAQRDAKIARDVAYFNVFLMVLQMVVTFLVECAIIIFIGALNFSIQCGTMLLKFTAKVAYQLFIYLHIFFTRFRYAGGLSIDYLLPFFLYCANTSKESYDSMIKDYQKKILGMGVLVTLSSLISAVAVGFFIQTASQSVFGTLIGSIVWFAIILHINKMMMMRMEGDKWAKRGSIALRVVFALVLSVGIGIPLKMKFIESSIISQVKKDFDSELREKNRVVAELQAMQTAELKRLDAEYKAISDERNNFQLLQKAENEGRRIKVGKYVTSGRRGKGDFYHELSDLISSREEQMKSKKEEIARVQRDYERRIDAEQHLMNVGEYQEPDMGFLNQFRAMLAIRDGNDRYLKEALDYFTPFIIIIFCFIELMPMLFKGSLPNTSDDEIDLTKEKIRKATVQRMEKEFEQKAGASQNVGFSNLYKETSSKISKLK